MQQGVCPKVLCGICEQAKPDKEAHVVNKGLTIVFWDRLKGGKRFRDGIPEVRNQTAESLVTIVRPK